MPSPLPADARPILAPHCRVVTKAPADIYLITDTDELRLSGELFCDLSVHLDGSSTIAEITERMVADGTATAEEVPAAVGILRDRGFVVDAREYQAPDALYRLWRGVDHAERAERPRIAIIGLGTTPVETVSAVLGEHGLAIVAADDPADAVVLLVDDYLNPQIAEIASATTAPVLLAMLAGVRPTIGPWLGAPGPCHQCLATRLRFNRQVELQLLEDDERMGPVTRGWTSSTATHGATEIALMIERRLLGHGSAQDHGDPTVATMLTIDHLTGARDAHHVVRRPQCPTCGTPTAIDDPRHDIVLESGALDAKDDGSYRRLTPQQTIDTYGHHVSRRTGVVEQLVRTSPTDSVVHVVESGINLATVQKGSKACGFRQSAGGKGTSAEQARAGALAEAIERYAATYTGEEPTILASLDSLGSAGLDPRTMTLFSAKQYADREQWNDVHKPMHRVPIEFDPALEMEWSPAWSLSRGERVWLPTPYSFYLYRGAHPKNGCVSDSNGNAAGTSMEDAILQGFFELVERDAVALWWYNRVSRPGVDFDAYRREFNEPYFDAIRAHYETELDREVWALDITSDLGIPAFVAASRARHGDPRVLLGFGAHRDARGALLRGLTEMNQMLGMIQALENPALEPGPTNPEVTWWRQSSLDEHAYLLPTGADRTPVDHAHDWSTDGKENVEHVVDLVGARGMEMHVLNATHPDIGMPVVKVMVPGMRHFWPRLGPGRLYDVPVELGWLSTAYREDELNPTPIFW